MNYKKLRHTFTTKTELHTHTTCSDGVLTPLELLKKSAEHSISYLSITDHDSTDGYTQVQSVAAEYEITLISGVEISCCEDGKDIHLLGYGFDATNDELQKQLHTIRNQRVERAHLMLEKLRMLDVEVSMEEVLLHAKGGSIGRPHIAAAMVSSGNVASHAEAFERYIYDGGPAFQSKQEHPVADAVKLLHNAGGVAVLAHPGKWLKARDIVRYIAEGIDGIEVYHPSHTRTTTNYLRNLAKRYTILATGGSDYHGSRDYDNDNFGMFPVEESVIEGLISHKSAQQLSFTV